MKKLLIVVSVGALLSGCGPIGSPGDVAPDHKVAQPANGIVEHPAKPKGMPNDALFVNWHVVVAHKETGNRISAPAKVKITAVSPNAQAYGNVHGGYPFSIYTSTPYTHTIWYQPGIIISSEITAEINPPISSDYEIECVATANGHDVAVRDIISGTDLCIASLNTEHI